MNMDKKCWKTIALVRVETLGPFVNTLAADDKYSRRNVQNFQHNFQRHYLNTRDFACNFYFFFKSTSNFEHFFLKKDESPSLSISQIIDSERGGYLNV